MQHVVQTRGEKDSESRTTNINFCSSLSERGQEKTRMFMSDTLEPALKRDLKPKRPSAQRAGGLRLYQECVLIAKENRPGLACFHWFC